MLKDNFHHPRLRLLASTVLSGEEGTSNAVFSQLLFPFLRARLRLLGYIGLCFPDFSNGVSFWKSEQFTASAPDRLFWRVLSLFDTRLALPNGTFRTASFSRLAANAIDCAAKPVSARGRFHPYVNFVQCRIDVSNSAARNFSSIGPTLHETFLRRSPQIRLLRLGYSPADPELSRIRGPFFSRWRCRTIFSRRFELRFFRGIFFSCRNDLWKKGGSPLRGYPSRTPKRRVFAGFRKAGPHGFPCDRLEEFRYRRLRDRKETEGGFLLPCYRGCGKDNRSKRSVSLSGPLLFPKQAIGFVFHNIKFFSKSRRIPRWSRFENNGSLEQFA